MGFLDDMASKWAAEDESADTDEAYEGFKQAKRAETVADAFAEAGSEQMSDEEALELSKAVVTWADVGAKKFLGPEYAQRPEEHDMLVQVTAPVLQKHMPKDWDLGSLDDLVPVELVMLAVVGYVYWPKYRDAQKARAASAAGPAEPKEVGGEVTARRTMHAVP